ncbi:MAG: response regulator [Planctomycetota bacterium]|nr:MAG: response regulator [Planctomycetota bacterium]
MKHKQILLAEDNEDDVKLTLRAFKKCQIHNIIVVQNGVEALDYLLGRGSYQNPTPPLPHMVLLDLNLPKLNGLEVLKTLRSCKRTCLLPVIILTSSREEKDILQSYQLGANSYIRKPVDFSKFKEVVQQLGHYWLVLNELPNPNPKENHGFPAKS